MKYTIYKNTLEPYKFAFFAETIAIIITFDEKNEEITMSLLQKKHFLWKKKYWKKTNAKELDGVKSDKILKNLKISGQLFGALMADAMDK